MISETAQIVIITVVTILSIVLSLIGFQMYMLLKELRETIGKTNNILADVDNVTSKLSQSTETVSGMFEGLRAVVGLIGAFKKGAGGKKDE